jgi:hypothetical protein
MVGALVAALKREPWTTVAPAEQRSLDVEMVVPSFDHDDPRLSVPSEPAPELAAQAKRATALNERLIRRKRSVRSSWL